MHENALKSANGSGERRGNAEWTGNPTTYLHGLMRADKRAMLLTAITAVVAGIGLAVILFVSTNGSRETPTKQNREISAGQANALRKDAEIEPILFANPFVGAGYYIALDKEELVALAVDLSSKQDCNVQYKASRNSFVDCDDEKVSMQELDRYATKLSSDDASAQLLVDLGDRTPAPN